MQLTSVHVQLTSSSVTVSQVPDSQSQTLSFLPVCLSPLDDAACGQQRGNASGLPAARGTQPCARVGRGEDTTRPQSRPIPGRWVAAPASPRDTSAWSPEPVTKGTRPQTQGLARESGCCAHLRRSDFLRGGGAQVPSLPSSICRDTCGPGGPTTPAYPVRALGFLASALFSQWPRVLSPPSRGGIIPRPGCGGPSAGAMARNGSVCTSCPSLTREFETSLHPPGRCLLETERVSFFH